MYRYLLAFTLIFLGGQAQARLISFNGWKPASALWNYDAGAIRTPAFIVLFGDTNAQSLQIGQWDIYDLAGTQVEYQVIPQTITLSGLINIPDGQALFGTLQSTGGNMPLTLIFDENHWHLNIAAADPPERVTGSIGAPGVTEYALTALHVASLPEPSTLLMAGSAGILGLWFTRRNVKRIMRGVPFPQEKQHGDF